MLALTPGKQRASNYSNSQAISPQIQQNNFLVQMPGSDTFTVSAIEM